jgi:hypothetical protein
MFCLVFMGHNENKIRFKRYENIEDNLNNNKFDIIFCIESGVNCGIIRSWK